ncbi:polysaccharide deacetylase family protein [Massilia agri]|uniref:Polysaccharide deacetylase family protein n=1 Tax=Massilia agri TaxID=1886785 RepID=A0ABT2ARD0_9BURK|nr:polysaccharide deacetylase family protein [Massilia agri]
MEGKAGDGARREPSALCISIHDVAPATWDDCARLAQAIRAVADVPLTWLVVPHYHRGGGDLRRMEAGLDALLARGDELALHGLAHLDSGPPARGWVERFLRERYSREGEFAALDAVEAARRIRLGLEWFAERGWPVRGFVPPAWLMGEGAWQALRDFDFDYTTTFSRFHLLRAHSSDIAPDIALTASPAAASLWSPSLVYAARNRSGRLASPLLADALSLLLARRPLIRLSLHPPDLHHPRLLRHAQATVARLLDGHTAMTKAAFAGRLLAAGTMGNPTLTSTDPRSRLHASHADRSRHSRTGHSA